MILANAIVVGQRKAAAEKEVQELRIQAGEAQRQVLMQQLQPHFLFNSLSVLKSLIGENAEAAQDYSVKLSEFLRYAVQAPQQDVVTLREELKFTHDYLDLQRVRFDSSFTCTIAVPEAARDQRLPVFALQTLVENAFKHNYFTEKSPLQLRINYQHGKLSVWNNVVSTRVTERSQTGLQNLSKRYLLIAGEDIAVFGDEQEFHVTLPLIQA